jgi:hypothetical protein
LQANGQVERLQFAPVSANHRNHYESIHWRPRVRFHVCQEPIQCEITISEIIVIESIRGEGLPGWGDDDQSASRAYGDRWLEELRSVVLPVPGVVNADVNVPLLSRLKLWSRRMNILTLRRPHLAAVDILIEKTRDENLTARWSNRSAGRPR